jgi:hypothetical protein
MDPVKAECAYSGLDVTERVRVPAVDDDAAWEQPCATA